MKILIAVCLTVSVLSLQGCGGQNSSPWTVKDSWYHRPSIEPLVLIEEGNKLPDKEIYKVTSIMQPKAEMMLKEKPVIQLSAPQVKAFVGGNPKSVYRKTPFLVRAVYLNEGTGKFMVYERDKKLWVTHGSLGRSAVPMKRQALVVFLKVRPTQVFVFCTMAA